MATVLLIVELFVTLALIGVVLIQRSEGGGLGIGTSQGMGSFMTGRGTTNLLTRTTAILATIFMALALVLALLNRGTSGVGASILNEPPPMVNPAGPAGMAKPRPPTAAKAPTPAPPTPAQSEGTPEPPAPTVPTH